MTSKPIKVTDDVISCSDNGQHSLVYIKLSNGHGKCQYCGQLFEQVEERKSQAA
ncbi:zinc-finger domain-containing protein [Pseudomonadota bacterium]